MPWDNFHIWRGKLPHWRADGVQYYVTFRHRRELNEIERLMLLRQLIRSEGRKLDLIILCVLPKMTEMMFQCLEKPDGLEYELSDVIESAKRKAGKQIVRKSGERFPPFYEESFDRIIRDESEYEERWESIFASSLNEELVEDPEDYDALWVKDAPR